MKKKTMAMLLGMALLMTGCGGASSQTAPSSDKGSAAETTGSSAGQNTAANPAGDTATVIAVPSEVMGDDNTQGSQTGVSAENAVIVTMSSQGLEDPNQYPTVHMEYDSISLAGTAYAKINDALQQWMKERKSAADQEYLELQKSLEKEKDTEGFYGYTSVHAVTAARADEKYVSVLASDVLYGNDISCAYEGRTYEVETGQQLTLADLGKNPDSFVEELKKAYVQKTGEAFWEDPVWYLDAAGIELVWGDSYYQQDDTVTASYSEIQELIRDDLLPFLTPGITMMSAYNTALVALKDLQKPTYLWMEPVWGEYEYPLKVTLHAGEKTVDIPDAIDMMDNYFVKKDNGKLFLLATCNLGSDDYMMYVYDVTDEKPTLIGEPLYGISVDGTYLSVDRITMAGSVDLFGTYTALADYRINDDGTLTDETQIYPIRIYSGYQNLTVKKDLPVTINGEDRMLSPGTVIRMTGTNKQDTMYFAIPETGEEGELKYTSREDDWKKYVDGIEDEEYFEMLPFAG